MAEGGYARFLSDTKMADIDILSVTDEGSDVSPDTWFGGCIYNQVWGLERGGVGWGIGCRVRSRSLSEILSRASAIITSM